MWITVLILAIAITLEPARPTFVSLILARPHPVTQLSAFLAGNLLSGLVSGLLILFVFHHSPLIGGRSDGAKLQIGIGVVTLVIAAIMVMNFSWVRRAAKVRPLAAGDDQTDDETPPQRPIDKASAHARAVLRRGNSPWLPGLLGLGTGLPSVDCLAVLIVIASSGAPPLAQTGALVMFLVVGNIIVIVPIATYLIAPDRTRMRIERFQTWIRGRSRRQFAALFAAAGLLQIVIGFSRL